MCCCSLLGLKSSILTLPGSSAEMEWAALFAFYTLNLAAWYVAEQSAYWPLLGLMRCWAAFLGWYTWDALWCWKASFEHRLDRGKHGSPSNKRRPDLASFESRLDCGKIGSPSNQRRPDLHQAWSELGLGISTSSLSTCTSDGSRPRRRGSASKQLPGLQGTLDDDVATHLDLDHVRLSFESFLWGRIYVGLGAWANMIFGAKDTPGALRFGVWHLLHRLGWPRTVRDPRRTCAELLLQTSLAIYLQELRSIDGCKGATGATGATATFRIPAVPHLVEPGRMEQKSLEVKVDLRKRRLVTATYGDDRLRPDEAMVLLNIACSFMIHPMLHAFANWSTTPESPNKETRRSSIATILFNYYGMNAFAHWCDFVCSLGMGQVSGETFKAMVSCGMRQHVPPHDKVSLLSDHSRFVRFVVKVRRFFLSRFSQYQADFPGIDGEALFLATVVHPLDHFSLVTLQSAHDMVCVNPEFHSDLELIRSTVVMCSDKLWLTYLLHDFSFEGSSHVLFRSTYDYAKTIDAKLAGEMECCVMR